MARAFQDELLDCIHCGLCMTSCPTYAVLGTEADSPRGRIYLMRAVSEGRTEVTDALVRHVDSCLGCRACETACPSGVGYARLLEHTRGLIEKSGRRGTGARAARGFLLDTLTSPSRLSAALAGSQLLGGLTGKREAGLPKPLQRLLSGTESAAGGLAIQERVPLRRPVLPEVSEPRAPLRYTVGMLTGCVASVLLHRTNEATRQVLLANGCRVIAPRDQGCCGALHAHNGYVEEARRLARRLIDAFSRHSVDAIIVNSAGCGSTMKEYGELLADDPRYAAKAAALALKVRDVSEFLASIEVAPFPAAADSAAPVRVAYHDACHLAHGQGIRAQPRALLRRVPGVELLEVRESDWCCGSAGIYNLTQPGLAKELQERKLRNIEAVSPDIVATGNPGCLLWIEAGLRERGKRVEVLHPVEILARAYLAGA